MENGSKIASLVTGQLYLRESILLEQARIKNSELELDIRRLKERLEKVNSTKNEIPTTLDVAQRVPQTIEEPTPPSSPPLTSNQNDLRSLLTEEEETTLPPSGTVHSVSGPGELRNWLEDYLHQLSLRDQERKRKMARYV